MQDDSYRREDGGDAGTAVFAVMCIMGAALWILAAYGLYQALA